MTSRSTPILTVLALVAATAHGDGVVSCADRAMERPHVLSHQGAELVLLETMWGTVYQDMRYVVMPPHLTQSLELCLAKARTVDAEAWRAVAALGMSTARLDAQIWDVTTRFGDAVRIDTVTSLDTPPWEMVEAINAWLSEQVAEEERTAFRNALWTLWVESLLASLPKEMWGYDVTPWNGYTYADEVREIRAAFRDTNRKSHQPDFSPIVLGGRIRVSGVRDELLAAFDNLEITHWDGRTLAEWGRDELLDYWVRDAPFEYTFRVKDRPEPISARSKGYGPWDVAIGFLDKIAYVRVAEFLPVTAKRFGEWVLPPIHEFDLKGLIVDLRGNPGGHSQPEALDLLFEAGVTVMSNRTTTRREPQRHVSAEGYYADVPLVVLIDGETGSMAEVFAAAVRQHDRGVLIGQRTWGKAAGQALYPIQQEGILRVTTQLSLYPGTEESWSGEGIPPHIEIAPGEHTETVSRILRRPVTDVERLYSEDPVFRHAVALFRDTPAAKEWEHLLRPVVPEAGR